MRLPRISVSAIVVLAAATCLCVSQVSAQTLVGVQVTPTGTWAGNLELGNTMNGVDGTSTAMIIQNVSTFAYTPSINASSYSVFNSGDNPGGIGSPFTGMAAVAYACSDANANGWNFQPMNGTGLSAGVSGLYAASGNTNPSLGLGYMTQAEYAAQWGDGTTFGGIVPPVGSVVVRQTYYGDSLLRGTVDQTDALILAGSLGAASNATDWSNGNYSYSQDPSNTIGQTEALLMSGSVGLSNLANQYGAVGGAGPLAAGNVAATPEPSTFCLLAAGLAALGFIAARRKLAR